MTHMHACMHACMHAKMVNTCCAGMRLLLWCPYYRHRDPACKRSHQDLDRLPGGLTPGRVHPPALPVKTRLGLGFDAAVPWLARVPKTDRAVITARGNSRAIWRERHGVHHVLVTGQGPQASCQRKHPKSLWFGPNSQRRCVCHRGCRPRTRRSSCGQ